MDQVSSDTDLIFEAFFAMCLVNTCIMQSNVGLEYIIRYTSMIPIYGIFVVFFMTFDLHVHIS